MITALSKGQTAAKTTFITMIQSNPRGLYNKISSRQEGTFSQKHIVPIIKLDEQPTYSVLDKPNAIVIVGLQELITTNGLHETVLLNKIQEAGGIHDYLRQFYPKFEGTVILSSIMPDDAIKGMTSDKHAIERYAKIINTLKPDYYLTLDSLTYRGRTTESRYAVEYLIKETPKLLELCPDSIPIGLIKGCNIELLSTHMNSLKKLDMQLFAFHTGDYFRGRRVNLSDAKMFVKHIKKQVPWLLSYGGAGSIRTMLKFWDADCFATNGHFIRAFNNQKREDERWRRNDLPIPKDQLIWRNLYMLRYELASIQKHAKAVDYIPEVEKEAEEKIEVI